jgi:hypothetical protein
MLESQLDTWRAASPQMVLPYLRTPLIHRSAWNRNSANFAFW